MLVDAGDTVLAPYAASRRRQTTNSLRRLGVEVKVGLAARSIDSEGISLSPTSSEGDGVDRLRARTVVWAAGVATSGVARQLAEDTGPPVDEKERIKVGPRCTVPGHPHIFAIGDAANVDDLPGLAEPAMQEGK